MSGMAPLLEIADLSVAYEGDRGTRQILRGVSLASRDGEVVGLVGESGSGKSVLLTPILRLLPPPWRVTSGSVRLRGQDLLRLDEKALGAIRGKQLGLALANPRQHLNPILPVGRQLAHVVQAHTPQRRDRAMARCARAAPGGRHPRSGRPPARLSARAERRHVPARYPGARDRQCAARC